MAGATMRSGRPPDTWIILSDRTRTRKAPDALAMRGEEALSEFTSEAPTRSNGESSVTASAGSTVVMIAPRHIPNSTVHAHAATFSRARWHAFERSERIELLTDQVRKVRARLRNLRSPTANTAVWFGGGTATGVLIMWFAAAQPPSTIVPPAITALTREPTPSATNIPASPRDVQPTPEPVRAQQAPQPPAIASGVATSGLQNVVVDQRVKPSSTQSTPAATRGNTGTIAPVARKNASGPYRGTLVLRSAPEGARVFVNDALVGSTPLTLENLPVGSRAVRIEADGYQQWSASARVVANQETHLSATLARADQ